MIGFRRSFLKTLGVGILPVGFNLFPFVWSSPEIRARVVAPDGRPVADAIVVANWNIEGSMNGRSLGQLALSEVVTDKDGWFLIPAWGPHFVLKGTVFETDPVVRIFHPDYAPLLLRNAEVGMKPAPAVIHFRYQDQAIRLSPWPGSLDARQKELWYLYSSLYPITDMPALDDRCFDQIIPRLLAAMLQAKRTLDPERKNPLLSDIEQFDPAVLASRPRCRK